MKSIEAIIERASDGTYSVFCKDEMFSGMGDTPELAKQNMTEQMQFFKETCKEDGFEHPSFLTVNLLLYIHSILKFLSTRLSLHIALILLNSW